MSTPWPQDGAGARNDADGWPDHDPSWADFAPCEGRREDGDPCSKIAEHVPPCDFPGEWRY